MPNYTVRMFQPEDAAYFPEFAAMGIDPARVPQPAVTGLRDGTPIGCAGFILDGCGAAEAWIILGHPRNGDGHWIAWTVRHFVKLWEKEGHLRRVWATAAEDRPEAIRFLEALGFTREGLLHAYCPDGGNSWMYARVRRDGA